jgi:hypothetical protein
MTNRKFLIFLALGGFEISLILFFSLLSVIGNDFSSTLTMTKVILVLIAIIVSVWGFINRKKGKYYLIASGVRLVLFVAELILLQTLCSLKELSDTVFWITISFFDALVVILIYLYKFNHMEPGIIEIWKKIGKVNFKKKQFFILALGTPIGEHQMKKIDYLIPICVIGNLIFMFILGLFKTDVKLIMLRVAILLMILLLSVVSASVIVSIINLIKTEKQLGFEFLTEFADEEELERLKKQK